MAQKELTPFSRDEMRNLKAREDERKRLEQVNGVVRLIYQSALTNAHSTNETNFVYRIRNPLPNIMDDILEGLRTLFPGCDIEYRIMCRGKDGKLYDISTIDKSVMPFINQQSNEEHIIIDWS